MTVYAAHTYAAGSSPDSEAWADSFAHGGTGYPEIDRSTNPGLASPDMDRALHADMRQIRRAPRTDDTGFQSGSRQRESGIASDSRERAGGMPVTEQDLLAPSMSNGIRNPTTSLANLSVTRSLPLSNKPFLTVRKVKKRISLRECTGYTTNVCPTKPR
jgi:hypothetical protein